MSTPQSGILAPLPRHARHLLFDLRPGHAPAPATRQLANFASGAIAGMLSREGGYPQNLWKTLVTNRQQIRCEALAAELRSVLPAAQATRSNRAGGGRQQGVIND